MIYHRSPGCHSLLFQFTSLFTALVSVLYLSSSPLKCSDWKLVVQPRLYVMFSIGPCRHVRWKLLVRGWMFLDWMYVSVCLQAFALYVSWEVIRWCRKLKAVDERILLQSLREIQALVKIIDIVQKCELRDNDDKKNDRYLLECNIYSSHMD